MKASPGVMIHTFLLDTSNLLDLEVRCRKCYQQANSHQRVKKWEIEKPPSEMSRSQIPDLRSRSSYLF